MASGTPKPRAKSVCMMVWLRSRTRMAYSAGTTAIRSNTRRVTGTAIRFTNSASACATHHSRYRSALIYSSAARRWPTRTRKLPSLERFNTMEKKASSTS